MPRLAIVDTYYPDFIESLPFNPVSTYEEELRRVLDTQFGTSDFYSRNLCKLGWDCTDIIANHRPLQNKWAQEHGFKSDYLHDILNEQIRSLEPDVIFCQDLGFSSAGALEQWSKTAVLAGQCSCPMPKYDNVKYFSCLFTSFPHYVKRFEQMGVQRVEFMPLAFEPSVLSGDSRVRDIDISFVGGVGRDSHWRSGTDALEMVAERFGLRFEWLGYGLSRLSNASALRSCYSGQAWGRSMYDVYRRSKIVINRHGEVAQGYANNLRLYESTGCGAMLITEDAPNLESLFPRGTVEAYFTAGELCDKIEHYLENDGERAAIADLGQRHTLANHTYAQRMQQVSTVLSEYMEAKAVRI